MDAIDVAGLPESAVRALEVIVQALRDEHGPTHAAGPRGNRQAPRELAVVKGTVLGGLSRREIYADVG